MGLGICVWIYGGILGPDLGTRISDFASIDFLTL